MSAQLKLVHSSSSQKRELPIRGEIHRASQNWRDRNRRLTPPQKTALRFCLQTI